MATKLLGAINLAKLSNVGIMNIKGKTGTKKCVVIPIDDNDIYIKVEEKTSQQGQKYISKKYSLGVQIYEKREPDQYGNTHYAKVVLSKQWIDSHTPQEVEEKNKQYLCDLKPVEIADSNQASTIPAQTAEAEDGDDLPF